MKYIAILTLLFFCAPALAGPQGLWLTEKEDVAIEIEECGEDLCGAIFWLAPDEDPLSDKGVPLCGAQVLYDFTPHPEKPDHWTGGTIYQADDHEHYNAYMSLKDEETIKVRAYIGVPLLGKTLYLSRAEAENYEKCVIPPETITPAGGD